jgi:hypothetical protein
MHLLQKATLLIGDGKESNYTGNNNKKVRGII